jgi:esterase/lipase superfamily enzyme
MMVCKKVHHWFRVLVAAMAVVTIGVAVLRSRPVRGDTLPCAEANPDVWVVSTRRLPGICQLPQSANFGVERLEHETNRWERSDLSALLSDSTRPLMIFIHGNRYEPASAKQQGLELARRATACAAGAAGARTVIFSWPSEQQGILLKDGRAKYERAFADGHYLARFLGHVEPGRPVAIVGYSYGAIITLEAFEDLVAAERAGRSDVARWSDRPAPVHVVLIAAAIRCDALAPRGPYREVVDCFDRLTLLNNSNDDALRFFPLVDCGSRAEALGYVGMPASWLPPHVSFSRVDAANVVGRTHGFPYYLGSQSLTRRICTGAFEGLGTAAE